MANKRMFKISVVDTDKFLDMPLGAQALYFHLGLRADDDGFIGNPKKIQNSIKASDDDVKILIAKDFIRVFETGVVVVAHWKVHNLVKNDRYKKTVYQDEYAMLGVDKNDCYILSSKKTKQEKYLSSKMEPKRSPNIDLDLDLEKNYYKKSEPLETKQKSSSCSEEEFLEKWISHKAKNKLNSSAYAATIKRKFLKKEQSILDEFEYWKKDNAISLILDKAVGKLIETTIGIKTILCVQKEVNNSFQIFFENGGSVLIKDIRTLKTIINQNNKETK
jgi:hypothetical protein